MPAPPHFTGSIWFVTLVAVMVSLGAQVLIGALTPFAALDWLDNESRQGPVVLIAGETSFWRGDAVIRALGFGIGALIACLLANSLSWCLIITLVVTSALSTVFALFPRPATLAQLALWAVAAPIATFAVSVLVRARRGNA